MNEDYKQYDFVCPQCGREFTSDYRDDIPRCNWCEVALDEVAEQAA